ncbi:tail fiber domain-containing protein [Actinoplanes oblitus]|uniref:Tail fiber domain-containing protein n=1 Tax=Actinoplanes oblitus TaxID=3040509 RepID=A0ABY8WPM4_9ACTN|nr:tail fiber domain-containing protein [Actinoplanes oblitus]WIM97710.1 tail fiber domain-containing protein [Actinoplanes oblitus]
MALNAGQPLTPEDLDDLEAETLTLSPAASGGALHITLNEGYQLYADNQSTIGADNSRVWLAGPNGGEAVIGPRAGASYFDSIRLRTDATTSSDANAYLDSSSQQLKRSTSSRRYKTDINDAVIELDLFRQLRVVSFQDRAEVEALGVAAAPHHLGLIAEEVHDLGLTQLVQYRDTEDGPVPDGVQYARLTLGLIQQLADAERRITALEARLGDAPPDGSAG